ncbi:hypothetical protein GJAV_G00102230 [Gymnothorax javanicus]|nr:hypothetical protein GJAV_G00102230 [Gymnothorax javanicus]
MLQDHHCVQPRTDCGSVCGLLHCAVPAHWGKGTPYRRMLLQEEAALAAHQRPLLEGRGEVWLDPGISGGFPPTMGFGWPGRLPRGMNPVSSNSHSFCLDQLKWD